MNKGYITRIMLIYARTHKNRGKNSLKSLAKKFGINDKIKLDKEK